MDNKHKPSEYFFVGDSNGKTLKENALVHITRMMDKLRAEIAQYEKTRIKNEAESVVRRARFNKLVCFWKCVRARKIQRQWRKANSNPEYKLCRDRLMYEFNEIIS